MASDKSCPGQFDGLSAGQEVFVFYRFAKHYGGFFMADNPQLGSSRPCIGRTDGWTPAIVDCNWDWSLFNPADQSTYVRVWHHHDHWYDRRGQRLRTHSKVGWADPRDVDPRPLSWGPRPVSLSFFVVRWGGAKPVNPATEGLGGWGAIGSTCSDNYINGFFSMGAYQNLGADYETISVFVQNSEDLASIRPCQVLPLMRGSVRAGAYFLWPIEFADGHEYPGYVERDRLIRVMTLAEAAGIPTRFPHSAHLYKVFASKEWTTWCCLQPKLKVPLTTQVSRSSISMDARQAAQLALSALASLQKFRASWSEDVQMRVPGPPKGIAKLGYSWEAQDVVKWTNPQQLADGLFDLASQEGSHVGSVLVQEWVDFDVEMRNYVIDANSEDPASWRPKKVIFTQFQHMSQDGGRFTSFDRFDRHSCLKRCFSDDEAAMQDVESQAHELIGAWLQWLRGLCAETPPVIRFDLMVKRLGPGQARVVTGELTELGGCFLGWPQGPPVVFKAMVDSCFRSAADVTTVVSQSEPERRNRPRPAPYWCPRTT